MPPTSVASTASVDAPAAVTGTPGWATSEFWVTLAPIVIFIVSAICALLHHTVPDPNGVTKTLGEIGAVVAAAYTLGRSLLKAVNAHGAARIAAAQAVTIDVPALTSELAALRTEVVALQLQKRGASPGEEAAGRRAATSTRRRT